MLTIRFSSVSIAHGCALSNLQYHRVSVLSPSSPLVEYTKNMTQITKSDVFKLASLARLTLTDDEIEKYTKEIAMIFHYIDKLQSINTEGLEPTYQVTGLSTVVRADEVVDYGASQTELLKNAPDTEDRLFKVKRMVG